MSTTVTIGSDRNFHRTPPSPSIDQKPDIAFDTVELLDYDVDLAFQLRGHSVNPLVDAAMPLFGLVIRLRRLKAYAHVDALHATIHDQISAIDEEVRRHNYDIATLRAYRYALCSFVDDAVLDTPWGANSVWTERSLLSIFQNETWGGEKFFTVLARMQMEPEQYRDVLEFKYFCLCLGFRGKYGLQHNQEESLNAIILKLHRILRQLRGEPPEQLTDAQANVASQRYRISRQWPAWSPWALVAGVLLSVYALFAVRLGHTSELVLRSLDGILKP
ncbi:type IVB secretion system protein IcmH/DotU [Cupriavidus basilensis]|uniref:Type IVB secretion system protein IcmH/DotU n=1 Tax=Cupriavidus basilensis TaxID=68895 RepID=A0ABT6AFU5_9BURK|nr:type IVB secretion system protein IcmH/DotU [Cupriavidus basilensis]MDF3831472.1 type IVB secretion system protein IcmH/DotU [Cupriavidus basilensis]